MISKKAVTVEWKKTACLRETRVHALPKAVGEGFKQEHTLGKANQKKHVRENHHKKDEPRWAVSRNQRVQQPYLQEKSSSYKLRNCRRTAYKFPGKSLQLPGRVRRIVILGRQVSPRSRR